MLVFLYSYCISNPYGKKDPILMVPTEQFERMIADAKSRLSLNLDIPTDPRSAFYTVFDGPILPRFVGRVHSNTDLENATQLLKLLKLENMVEDGSGKAVLAYGEKVKLIYNRLSHLTSKAEKKEKKRLKAVARQKGWGQEMKRAQRYLGMRSKTVFGFDEQSPFATDDGKCWRHRQILSSIYLLTFVIFQEFKVFHCRMSTLLIRWSPWSA